MLFKVSVSDEFLKHRQFDGKVLSSSDDGIYIYHGKGLF